MILKHKNYQNNRLYEKTLPEGMLNGQGIAPLNRYRYGLFSFSWCGCEIIAVYNLLKMYGKPQKLCDISKEIYPYGHLLCGFFGTNVYVLKHYFNKHSIPVKTVYKESEFFRLAPKGKYGVVSFWTGRVMASSIHTVAYRIEKDSTVSIFNRYNNRNFSYHFDTVEEAFGTYTFIVANIL